MLPLLMLTLTVVVLAAGGRGGGCWRMAAAFTCAEAVVIGNALVKSSPTLGR